MASVPSSVQSEFVSWLDQYSSDYEDQLRQELGGEVQECGGEGGNPGPCPQGKGDEKKPGIGGRLKAVAVSVGRKIAEQYKSLAADFGHIGAVAIIGVSTAIPIPGTSIAGPKIAQAIKAGASALFAKMRGASESYDIREADTSRLADMAKAVKELLATVYAEFGEEPPELDDEQLAAMLSKALAGEVKECGGEGSGKPGPCPEPGKGDKPVVSNVDAGAKLINSWGDRVRAGDLPEISEVRTAMANLAKGMTNDDARALAVRMELQVPKGASKKAIIETILAKVLDRIGIARRVSVIGEPLT